MYLRNGYIVGGSGDSAPLTAIEYCLKWPKTPSTETFARWMFRYSDAVGWGSVELLVVTRAKVWHLSGGAVCEVRLGAIGSGAAFALGYLEAKPSDLDGAVAAACKFDPYCAGPIRRLDLPK